MDIFHNGGKVGKESFSLAGVEMEVDLGSEVDQDDLVLLTTECLTVHLHKTAPVLQTLPASSVWLIARNLTGQLLDSTF